MFNGAVMDLIRAGGWVMYPLLALSLISLTLCLERLLFWMRHGEAAQRRRARAAIRAARAGDWSELRRQAERGRHVVATFLAAILDSATQADGSPPRLDDADVIQAVEWSRGGLERFSAALSATITAAPMLGILGTVTGIIKSFRLLGVEGPVTDPISVAGGIAEALLTTAFGLVIALVTLFPYTVFRARADRSLGGLEALGQALVAATTARPRTDN